MTNATPTHKRKTPQGGARKGAGRKSTAATILKKKLAEHGVTEADYAFAFHCHVMRDEEAPRDQRLAAAREVMNRVLGKPAQSLSITTPEPVKIEAFDYGHAIATIAPGPVQDNDGGRGNIGGGDGAAVGENVDGGE